MPAHPSSRRAPFRFRTRLALAAVLRLVLPLTVVIPSGIRAQSPASAAACQGPEHHAFDYWVGSWRVLDAQGAQAGTNRITRIAAGCGLLEEWTAADGSPGKSLNFYEPASGAWRQVWVGAGGSLLDLRGGPVDGVMTLGADRVDREGRPLRHRIRWIPRGDGVVEQLWQISRDEGANWTTSFQGFYHPVPEGTVDPR